MPIGSRAAAAKIWRGPASCLTVTPRAPRTIRISRLSHNLSHQPPFLQLQCTRHTLPSSTLFRSCSTPLVEHLIPSPPTTAPAVRRPHTTKSTSTKMAPTREWTAEEVRDTFLKFFEERGHTFGESHVLQCDLSPRASFPSASLIFPG